MARGGIVLVFGRPNSQLTNCSASIGVSLRPIRRGDPIRLFLVEGVATSLEGPAVSGVPVILASRRFAVRRVDLPREKSNECEGTAIDAGLPRASDTLFGTGHGLFDLSSVRASRNRGR